MEAGQNAGRDKTDRHIRKQWRGRLTFLWPGDCDAALVLIRQDQIRRQDCSARPKLNTKDATAAAAAVPPGKENQERCPRENRSRTENRQHEGNDHLDPLMPKPD
jgi:hypothetical protein